MLQPIVCMLEERRVLQEDNAPVISDADAKHGFEKLAKKLVEPIHGNPDAFVRAYLRYVGKPNMTVGELRSQLVSVATKLRQNVKEDLCYEYGLENSLLLTEGLWSGLMTTLTWLGKPFKWIFTIITTVISGILQSWVGRHPVGRLALCFLLLFVSNKLYDILVSMIYLYFGAVPWFVPVAFIGSLAVAFLVYAIDVLDLANDSETIMSFLRDDRAEGRLSFVEFFTDWGWDVGK